MADRFGNEEKETVADYNEDKQKLLINVLLSSEDIFTRCVNIINPKYFVAKLRPAVRYMVKHAEEYRVLPKIVNPVECSQCNASRRNNASDSSGINYRAVTAPMSRVVTQFHKPAMGAKIRNLPLGALACCPIGNRVRILVRPWWRHMRYFDSRNAAMIADCESVAAASVLQPVQISDNHC